MMDENWNRREFLKRLGIVGAGAAGLSGAFVLAKDKGRKEPRAKEEKPWAADFRKGLSFDAPVLAVGKGSPDAAVRAAVKALGGMQKFVKKGDTVAIKPNIAWDRTPLQAATTNPAVVAAVVSMCLEAGASSVIVTDNTCNEAKRCFTRSGIWKAAEAAGAKIVLPEEHRFSTKNLGGVLGSVPVLMPAVEVDRLINIAIAKHHGLSKYTGAMKNLYGLIGGSRNRHHQQINDSIADLTAAFLPTLSIVDAHRVLLRNGPQGGNIEDTREMGQVAACIDPVVLDAYTCTLIDVSASDLPYLAMGEKMGLGTANIKAVKKVEVS